MTIDIEKAIADLRNSKAGWVTRRDAAETLGRAAAEALAVLREHREEPDVDVRSVVQATLASLEQGSPLPPPTTPTQGLAEMVRACEKPQQREARAHKNGFAVEVTLPGDRHQCVYVLPGTGRDDTRLVRVFTVCGDPTPEASSWALRSNAKLVDCFFAAERIDSDERLLLVSNLVESELTAGALKKAIKQIAFYGDWLEDKLTGLDEF
jgi:hypothetical protein